MKLSQGTLFALIALPALAAARLQPHVKRQSSLVKRAPDSTTDNGTDDCNEGHSTTKHSTIPHHRHHKHHYKQDHHQQQHQPVQTSPPKKDNNTAKGAPPTRKPVEQPVDKPIEQPVQKPTEQPVKQPVIPIRPAKGNLTKGGLLAALAASPKDYSGFYIGTTVRSSYLDGSYDKCILPHANLLVPEYEAKSAKIEPQEFEWKTSPVDTIVSYTKQHGLNFKLHALYWEQDLAPYFQNLNGRPDALKAAMLEHTKTIMQRYGNDAVLIDVINEPLKFAGTGELKDDVFTSTLGKDFIPFAFNTAKAANPHPLLSLNENDVEGYHSKGLSAKYQGLYDLVKDLKSKGVHIDVVSFESHFITGEVPKEFPTVLKNFASLGVRTFISELDIKNDKGQDQQQAQDYAMVFDACLQNYPSCMGVNIWGVNDKVSWLGEQGRGTLFDANCDLKPLVGDAVKAVLSGSKTYN